MRIPTKKNQKKILIAVIAAVLIVAAVVGVLYYFKVGPFAPQLSDTVNLKPASKEDKATGSDIKKSSLDQVTGGKQNTSSDPSPDPQPIQGSDKKSVGMEITATNQTSTSLQVRTFIQTITNNGTCNLTAKNSQGTAYTATAGVQAQSSTTTCKGFDIPLSELNTGTWTVTIDFSNDNLIASTSKEITIK